MPGLVPSLQGAPQALRSNGRGCRVIGTATARNDIFAITVNEDTMGVVPVDLERSAPERREKSRSRQQDGAI